ncbi:MAG: biotin attachment protein [Halieaceae bacterium]|nr:biotin attachment protein [Halieaceae bacterium]
MAVNICVPQWGMGITEGRIVKWLKAEGESITEGEPLVEIETAKAVQELESPASGTLTRILVKEQTVVPVREVIGEIE